MRRFEVPMEKFCTQLDKNKQLNKLLIDAK